MDKAILKNIISLFGIKGVDYIIPLITLPYLVRVLGPEGYGILAFSLAVVQYCCLLTDYGFNLSATKQIAVNREDAKEVSRIFWSVLVCKSIMACISVILVSIAIFFVSDLNNMALVIFSGMLMVLGNILFPSWLFQGKEKMGLIAIGNITAKCISIPLVFIFVNKEEHVAIAALITGITSVIASVLGLYLVKRHKWITWYRPTFSDLGDMMSDGWHVFISTAAISLYTTSTTLILGFVSTPVSVGYFVAADKLRQAAQGLITPISQSFYPRINAVMSKNENEGFQLIRKLLLIQGSGTFFISFFMFILSPSIIFIVYGNEYKPSIFILQILSWLPFIIGISNVLGIQTLLVCGFKSLFSRILLFSGFVNISLIFPLSYLYSASGAATSILITEILVTTVMIFFVIKKNLPIIKRSI